MSDTKKKEIPYTDKLSFANSVNVELDRLVGPDNDEKAIEILLLAAIARCGPGGPTLIRRFL